MKNINVLVVLVVVVKIGECFSKNSNSEACAGHIPGTFMNFIGRIFLGLPKGFNRLGPNGSSIEIHETYDDFLSCMGIELDKLNKYTVPVWKHLTENGHTLIRHYMPRRNDTTITIILENCMDRMPNAIEITKEDIEFMD